MAQMQNAQSVALQLEKVRDKLPLLYERDDILLTMIQRCTNYTSVMTATFTNGYRGYMRCGFLSVL